MIETTEKIPNVISQRLPKDTWQERQRQHQEAIADIVDPYLEQKQHQKKDPVLDFLFEYYAFRPSHLKRWSPGTGTLLEGADRQSAPALSELTITADGAFLDPALFPENRQSAAHWILSLLRNSINSDPSFGCFGMHEWAMVYKAENIRHAHLPLRMDQDELARFVESRPLVCTHFDAFRFFTAPAKPMNKFALSQESLQETEQPGCLHTNMDLYKWAFKLFPWIASSLIREAFFLALDTRLIDMKASPYDLRDHDITPIKIETPAGRKEYIDHQREIYQRSIPIRNKLIKAYQQLILHF